MNDQESQTVSFVRDPKSFSGQQLGEATTQIQYESQGHALVIGTSTKALQAAKSFAQNGVTVVEIDPAIDSTRKQLTDDGIAVFTVPVLALHGYLGAFTAKVPSASAAEQAFDLAVSVYLQSGCFDVVLDLSEQPLMPMLLPPFGYKHASSAEQIQQAILELQDMKGEFEKPRYFNYNAAICAHSRSELGGCRACIDVCTTNAIVSVGEGVQVDPFLCQGCGSCATTCPTGAMSYSYPRPSNAIDRARTALLDNDASVVLLHGEAHKNQVESGSLSDGVLAFQVEEITAFGADFWLSLLAGPACRVVLVHDMISTDPGLQALQSQIELVDSLLAGLGIEENTVVLIGLDGLNAAEISSVLHPDNWSNSILRQLTPASYATHNDKRQTIRLALDALSEQLTAINSTVELPAHAPFGQIMVNTDSCTLCMACVSTCPAKALLDGQDTPALRFVEANCVQCGLCEQACPESAISLEPRYVWNSIEARKIKTLHEEEPFNCLVCHTPFTTLSMLETMSAKLAGHWMFKDEKALRRLKMCGDCRVRDMFEEDRAGIDVHSSSEV